MELVTDNSNSWTWNSQFNNEMYELSTGGDGSLQSQNEYDRKRRIDLSVEIIRGVRQRPILYDIRIPIAKRTREARDKLWAEIQRELPEPTTLEQMYKTWKYLRDRYIKCRKTRKLNEIDGQTKIANFRYYKLMKFIEPTLVTQRYSVSNQDGPNPSPNPENKGNLYNQQMAYANMLEDEDYDDEFDEDYDDEMGDDEIDYSYLAGSAADPLCFSNQTQQEQPLTSQPQTQQNNNCNEVIDLDDDNTDDETGQSSNENSNSISKIVIPKENKPPPPPLTALSHMGLGFNQIKQLNRFSDDELEKIISNQLEKCNKKDNHDKFGEIIAERLRCLKLTIARKCECELLTVLAKYEIENSDLVNKENNTT